MTLLERTTTAPPATTMMNPFLNPYMNPLINPAAPTQRMTGSDALYYMYAAQAAKGGLGSGRIANGTGAPSRASSSRSRQGAAVPNSAQVPGGSASKYFGNLRGSSRSGLESYYHRRGVNSPNRVN